MRVKTLIKSGGITAQHNRLVLKVRSGVKSGGICFCGNHTRNLVGFSK